MPRLLRRLRSLIDHRLLTYRRPLHRLWTTPNRFRPLRRFRPPWRRTTAAPVRWDLVPARIRLPSNPAVPVGAVAVAAVAAVVAASALRPAKWRIISNQAKRAIWVCTSWTKRWITGGRGKPVQCRLTSSPPPANHRFPVRRPSGCPGEYRQNPSVHPHGMIPSHRLNEEIFGSLFKRDQGEQRLLGQDVAVIQLAQVE